ncbi:PH domain-containing protein [Kaistella haifensis]|nr:PH domain-containing protein [Kaistella haifensis]
MPPKNKKMKMIPVKYGLEILLVVYGAFFFMVYQYYSEPKPVALIIMALYFIFVTICIFGSRYSIDNHILKINNGFFGSTNIDIRQIKKIEKTWNAIASPAPSLFGRVEIFYGNKSIVISPKNWEEFKQNLLSINPSIIVNY